MREPKYKLGSKYRITRKWYYTVPYFIFFSKTEIREKVETYVCSSVTETKESLSCLSPEDTSQPRLKYTYGFKTVDEEEDGVVFIFEEFSGKISFFPCPGFEWHIEEA